MICFDAMIPMICITLYSERRLCVLWLIGPQTFRVRMIIFCSAKVSICAHRPVSVIRMKWTFGSVDGNVVEVNPETISLCVSIGEQTPLKHLVRRKTDSWYHVSR